MKIQLEGDPTEIIGFLQRLHFQQDTLKSTTAFIAPSVMVAEREPVEEVEIQAASPVLSTDDDLVQHADIEPNLSEPKIRRTRYQIPIKDSITQFLEGRKKAKISDISAAIGIPAKTISPRIAEMVSVGLVERVGHKKRFHNDFALVRKIEGIPSTKAPASPTKAPALPEKAVSKVSMRQQIVDFLSGQSEPVSSRDIRDALKSTSSAVTSRLTYLVRDGVVHADKDKTQHFAYSLPKTNASPAQPVVQQEQAKPSPASKTETNIDSRQAEFLRVVGAMVDHPNATYYDMERITQIPRGVLTSLLIDLEQMKLVERVNSARGPVEYKALVPTDQTEMPIPYTSLDEAIHAALKKHPRETSAQISIRLMKSHRDVAARLEKMIKTTLRRNGDRYSVR